MEQMDYMTFLIQKQQSARPEGIKRIKLPDRMFDNLVAEMNHAVGIERVDKMTHGMEVPVWLS